MPFKRPRLKEHLTSEVVGDARAFVIGEDRSVLLEGAAIVAMLPLLDGWHTFDEIVAELDGRYAVTDLFRAQRKLEALQLLADGRPDLPEPELAYWDATDVDATLVADKIPASVVAVVPVGNVDPAPFVNELRRAGLTVQANEPDDLGGHSRASLVIAVVDDYVSAPLADLNKAMLSSGTPWLLTKPAGVRVWLGPVLRPGVTGCWACLRQRLQENRQVERYLLGRRDKAEPITMARADAPLTAGTVAGLLLPDIVEALATGTSQRLDGTLVTLDRRTLESANHNLIRQPQCPECGDAGLITNRDPRVELQPQQVRFSADGGYRTEPPETTLARLSKHISPILGAVSSLTPVTESDSGVTHAYAAGHNFALIGDNMAMLRRNLRGQSGGKGRTDIQARVSAVAEAIERYCGIWRGDEPVRRASYDQLDGEHRVHIAELVGYSDAQYASRTEWNDSGKGRFNLIPQPFRTDFACDWTTTWSLTHNRPTFVPAGYVWFGHPDITEHFFTIADGNGNAAGSVREEAILQGLCELIERDSVGIWWYNRLRRPGFDLDSLDDPYVEMLRRYYRGMGRDLWMIDITSDLGVPTFAAISRRTNGPTQDIGLGFGSHIDPYIAAMRALTEMNQFLPSISQHNPDGSTIYWEDDPLTLDWWQNTRLEDEPWLVPSDEPPTTTATHSGLVRETLTDDLQGLLDRVQAAGLEVLVADQSRPDLELSAVKVMVPGLRHFWRRLGPGRLYDVPVQMGWLDAPLGEDELNPKTVFF